MTHVFVRIIRDGFYLYSDGYKIYSENPTIILYRLLLPLPFIYYKINDTPR